MAKPDWIGLTALVVLSIMLGIGLAISRSSPQTVQVVPSEITYTPPIQPSPTPQPTPSPTPEPKATLIAVGDIMLSRFVATKIKQRGQEYPYIRVKDFLATGDAVFGNLET